jgi:NDP-sugar pyrophosphorylase family protein
MVQDALGDGSRWSMHLRYVHDGPRLLGTGGALRAALPALGDPFFVLYGDSYLECDYAAVEHAFDESRKSGLMTVYRNDDRWDRSNVLFAGGRIARYDKERPSPDMRHIDYGLGVFRTSVFADRPAGEVFDLATVYRDLLAKDDLAACEVFGRFYEVGSPAGLEDTRAYLASRGA